MEMNEITVKTNNGTLTLELNAWEKYGKSRTYINSRFGKLVWDNIAMEFISCHGEISNPFIRNQVEEAMIEAANKRKEDEAEFFTEEQERAEKRIACVNEYASKLDIDAKKLRSLYRRFGSDVGRSSFSSSQKFNDYKLFASKYELLEDYQI